MLKVMIGTGQGARPAARRAGGIRAIGFGAMAAAVVLASVTSATAQSQEPQFAQDLSRRLSQEAYQLATERPKAPCRTPDVEQWILRAQDLLRSAPIYLDPESTSVPTSSYVSRKLQNRKYLSWGILQHQYDEAVSLPPCLGFAILPIFGPQPGAVIGLQIIKVTGDGHFVERSISTDEITNTFDERKDPVGAGLLLGYRFNLSNNIGFMPFLSVDFPNISVKQTFANGSFLGTASGVSGTAGVKVGPQFNDVWLYGIAGVSALGETLKVNFLPVTSSTDTIVPGATVGAGIAYKLPNLPNVSLFAEYQHTWWRDGKFNTPAASPLFNYTFARQDDVAKLGFTVSLGAPPLPSLSNLPVKAPISK